MTSGELPGDRKAQPGAHPDAGLARGPRERLEDALAFRGRDAGPLVRDGGHGRSIRALEREPGAAAGRAVGRVLDRVVDEDQHALIEAVGVREDDRFVCSRFVLQGQAHARRRCHHGGPMPDVREPPARV